MNTTMSSPAGLAQADFQLAGPMKDRRIVVAMSGGVDSSVVAALAARSGAEVIGVLALVNRSPDAASLYEREGIPLMWVFTGEELLRAARG